MPFPVTHPADRSLLSFTAYHAPAGIPAAAAVMQVTGTTSARPGADARHEGHPPPARAGHDRRGAPRAAPWSPLGNENDSRTLVARDAIDRLALWPGVGRAAFTVSVEQLAVAARARTAPLTKNGQEPQGHVVITVDGGQYLLPVQGAAVLPPIAPAEAEAPKGGASARASETNENESAHNAGEPASIASGREGIDTATADRRHQDQLVTSRMTGAKPMVPTPRQAQKAYAAVVERERAAAGPTPEADAAPAATPTSEVRPRRLAARVAMRAYAQASPAAA